MNKGLLKGFAVRGREILRQEIIESARISKTELDEGMIEKQSYIWFIRFTILRFIDLKGYMPLDCRYFSEESCNRSGILLKRAVAYLKSMLPHIFDSNLVCYEDKIFSDTSTGKGFLQAFIESIDDEAFTEVEIIGWMHQFYMSKEHETIVGMNHGIIRAKDIPAATQLFTPGWIVQYMVENSLGRFWIEAKEDNSIERFMNYYIKQTEKNSHVQNMIKEHYGDLIPEDIKFLDPACGCGHILSYAFDILYEIYRTKGYRSEDIPCLILKNNLYGLDIDSNAVNIALVMLILKAREKDKDFFEKAGKVYINSNIAAIIGSKALFSCRDLLLGGVDDTSYAVSQIEQLSDTFLHAEELGSLIEAHKLDSGLWEKILEHLKIKDDCYELVETITKLIRQTHVMSQNYHVVCTNPPYLSKKYMDVVLKGYIKENFSSYYGDLFSVFIVRSLKYTKINGYTAFMTPFVWMFIKEYEELRRFIINNKALSSLIQLEYSAFSDAAVPVCTFVLGNYKEAEKATFIRLSDFKGSGNQSIKVLEAVNNPESVYRYMRSTTDFLQIPSSPMAYWISEKMLKVFSRSDKLGDYIDITGSQNVTGDNEKYLRKHWEVEKKAVNKKWQFYNKGGDYRKWYGNLEYVVNWSEEARSFYKKNKTSNLLDNKYCFRDGITYSAISLKGFAVREAGEYIYDKGGPTLHMKENELKYYILALLNSKVTASIMYIYNPTINYQVQDVKNIPFILAQNKTLRNRINVLSSRCVEISRRDWNFKELAWEYNEHPFISFRHQDGCLAKTYEIWERYCREQRHYFKVSQEELNEIFIKLYGLEDGISATVSEEDLNVFKSDLREDIKSFISYGIGCILGRYEIKGVDCIGAAPITKTNIFEDNLTNRFLGFVKACFGEDNIKSNLEFIATALTSKDNISPIIVINKYLLDDFFKDHTKVFKKRPVYWMFNSGKKSQLKVLVYMHMLDKLLLEKIRLNYVEKLLQILLDEKSPKRRAKVKKNNSSIEELQHYSKLLQHYYDSGTEINFEDGIAKNYLKFVDLMQ